MWLDLFAATAARDAAAMASIGWRTLQADRDSRNLGSEYAYTAALTGLLCLGDTNAARALAAEGTRHWLRRGPLETEIAYLHALAAAPPRPPRCRAN